MREILFKAKTYQGEWVFGSIHTVKGVTKIENRKVNLNENYILIHELPYYMGWDLSDTFSAKKVIPETICQFAGFNINDKNVFEYDEIKHNDNVFVVIFTTRFGWRFVAKNENLGTIVNDGILMINHNSRDLEWFERVNKYLEIIGNIHDNAN